MMRRLSVFESTASISFAAEVFSRSLYSSKAFHARDKRLECRALFISPSRKHCQILGVLPKSNPDSIVNHLRDRAIRRGGLQAKRLMDVCRKVDSRALWAFHSVIMPTVALKRQDVIWSSKWAGIKATRFEKLAAYAIEHYGINTGALAMHCNTKQKCPRAFLVGILVLRRAC